MHFRLPFQILKFTTCSLGNLYSVVYVAMFVAWVISEIALI